MVNVGKYTSPMDPMGTELTSPGSSPGEIEHANLGHGELRQDRPKLELLSPRHPSHPPVVPGEDPV